MHLDNCLLFTCQAFLSSSFGSSPGEYACSPSSSFLTDKFIHFLIVLTFIFECFPHMASPTHLSVPSKLRELEPSSNSCRNEDMANWGPCKDLLHIFECIGCWVRVMFLLSCIMDGVLCVILSPLTFFIVLTFAFERSPSTASVWCSFNLPTPWEVGPSFSCCWVGSTAVWGPYVIALHVFMCVEGLGTLSHVFETAFYAPFIY